MKTKNKKHWKNKVYDEISVFDDGEASKQDLGKLREFINV